MFQDFLGKSENESYNRIIKWMWRLAIAIPIGVFLVFFILSFSDLPSVVQLENPRSEEATQIFAANNEVIGRVYIQNRVPVPYDSLSPYLIDALISTEDERYWDHAGIDFRALARAIVKTGIMGDPSGGGASTITQQLAKLLFTGERADNIFQVIVQKLKEWIIAIRLERRYTKQEIIAMYLNKFDFIYEAYGIKAASEIYFGKSPSDLDILESATLVGMLKNPWRYNPLRASIKERVLRRRMVVLKQMQKNGKITAEQYQKYGIEDTLLHTKYTRQTHIDGLAPYFRTELSKDIKRILARKENLKSDGTPYDLYRDGLKIYTSIDYQMQKIAEEEMIRHMAGLQKVFDRHWKGMDPWRYKSQSPLETSLETRKNKITRLIRSSERYQGLRAKYLGDILEKLESEVPDMKFSEDDHEVSRIISENKKKGLISRLVKQKYISKEAAENYRKVLNSDHFSILQEQWDKLQKEVEVQFKKKVKMRVFAYPTKLKKINLDAKMEKDTTMTPLDSIKYHQMFLQTGIMAVDPQTGFVKVWVGGINYKYFKFDHIRTERQVGSTFKPFVYATAIAQQGISPCYPVYDLPITIGPGDGSFGLEEPWTPRNSDDEYSGELFTLKDGLRKSKNTVSAYLMKQLGSAEPIREVIHQMGIDKNKRYPNGRLRVPRAPSICLGATDLTVMEMTGAYTTFANNGLYNKPNYILRIEDRNGHEIYKSAPVELEALPPNANFVMTEMLRYAAPGLQEIKSAVGGKTGTTNEYVDGWFMGITPRLVVGTWVGGEDRWIRFRNITYGQGSVMAKPFFRNFMKRVEADTTINFEIAKEFYRPSGNLGIVLDCSEYSREVPEFEGDSFYDEDNLSEDPFGDEAIDPEEEFDDESNF